MFKIFLRYCGLVTILKKVGYEAYTLLLPEHSRMHAVFHANRLRKRLVENPNVVDANVLLRLHGTLDVTTRARPYLGFPR